MWAAMTAGAVAAGSMSFITLVELGGEYNKNKAVQFMFKTRLRATLWCTASAFIVASFVEPISGVVFEVCYFPACWIKHYRIKKMLREAGEDPDVKVGDFCEALVDGSWNPFQKQAILEKVGHDRNGPRFEIIESMTPTPGIIVPQTKILEA